MNGKSTDDLTRELMNSSNIDSYIKDNQEYFANCGVSDLLVTIFETTRLTKAELARRSGMSEVYLHQLFSGRRTPSRDKLLCLCIGMQLTFDETAELLKRASFAQLYPRVKREAIISYGIVHHTPLEEINDKLFVENEKALC